MTIKGHIVSLEPKLHHLLFIHTLAIQYSEILPHLPSEYSEHCMLGFPKPAKRPNTGFLTLYKSRHAFSHHSKQTRIDSC